MRHFILLILLIPTLALADVRDEVGDVVPLIEITTDDGSEPTYQRVWPPEGMWGAGITNNDYVCGSMTITERGNTLYDSGPYVAKESGVRIKVRGNTSTFSDVLPYKIKLSKKSDLFMRGDKRFKHKDYVLIRTYYDNDWQTNGHTSMIQQMGYIVTRAMDMPGAPQWEFANVAINGRYKGLYLLVEAVAQGEGRTDVADDGFILEYDPYFWNETHTFRTPRCIAPCAWTYKYPDGDDITTEQETAFRIFLMLCEDEVWSGRGGEQYLDLTSFARWLLIHDILNTHDAGGSNIFVCRHDMGATTRIAMATPWDFDTIHRPWEDLFSTCHEQGFFWFGELLNTPAFVSEYVRLWREYRPVIYDRAKSAFDALEADNGTAIEAAVKHNMLVNYNTTAGGFYDDSREMLAYLERRLPILDTKIEAMATSVRSPRTICRESHATLTLGGVRAARPAVRGVYISGRCKFIQH